MNTNLTLNYNLNTIASLISFNVITMIVHFDLNFIISAIKTIFRSSKKIICRKQRSVKDEDKVLKIITCILYIMMVVTYPESGDRAAIIENRDYNNSLKKYISTIFFLRFKNLSNVQDSILHIIKVTLLY